MYRTNAEESASTAPWLAAVVSAEYKDDTKPRTLFLKVKSNDIQPLSD